MTAGNGEKLLWDDTNFSQQSHSVDAITGVYAKHMLLQADIARTSAADDLSILDNACGNGIVTHELQNLLKDRPQETFHVTCGDLADAMLESATERMKKEDWSNVRILKVDAQDTKLSDQQFTHVFSNFAVMLVPQPDDMLDECYRMLKPRGLCAFTTWKEVGWINDIRSAMLSIPGLPHVPEAANELSRGFGVGEWTDADFIKATMAKHDFVDVEVNSLPNTTILSTDEDIKRVVRVCTSILTKKFWTEEQQSQYDNDSLLENIEQWLRHKYQGNDIEWHWTALVTTGRKR